LDSACVLRIKEKENTFQNAAKTISSFIKLNSILLFILLLHPIEEKENQVAQIHSKRYLDEQAEV